MCGENGSLATLHKIVVIVVHMGVANFSLSFMVKYSLIVCSVSEWPLTWKTWKSHGIEEWSGKSQGK